jgi:hypothetical protein
MNRDRLFEEGQAISTEAGVLATLHNYFVTALPRLDRACRLFNLF